MNPRTKPSRRRPHPAPTPQKSPRKGAALQVAAALVAAGAVVWAGIASVSSSSSTVPKNTLRKFRTPTTAIEVEASLGELGLTPKVLASAGFTAQQTTTFAGAAASYMRSHMPDYRAAQDAVFQARKEVDRLLRLIQGSVGTPEDQTALITAQNALNTAIAQRQAILDAGMAAGTAALPGGPVQLLNQVRANHRLWDLPEQFMGDSRSEPDWMTLSDAISNDRYATRTGTEPDPAAHTFLVNAQGTPNASAAIINLANLPDIRSAWLQAMGQ